MTNSFSETNYLKNPSGINATEFDHERFSLLILNFNLKL
jgi:hypothetical protein